MLLPSAFAAPPLTQQLRRRCVRGVKQKLLRLVGGITKRVDRHQEQREYHACVRTPRSSTKANASQSLAGCKDNARLYPPPPAHARAQHGHVQKQHDEHVQKNY
eukprot:359100-Chlamydomonas_euryale.AAC.1